MKTKNSKIKRSILLSYIFVTLIPLISLGIIFALYNAQLYKQANEYNAYVQNQIGSNVSDILVETQSVCSNIYSVAKLNEVLNLTNINQYYTNEAVANVLSYLTTVKQYSKHVSSIYLYIEKTDTVLSELGALDSQSYYEINEYSVSFNYEEWKQSLSLRPLSSRYKIVSKKGENDVFCYFNILQPPYLLNKSADIITLVVCVPQKEYFRSAADVEWFPYCDSYIFDNENKLLFSRIETKNPIETPVYISDVMKYKNTKNILSTIASNKTSKWSVLTVVDKKLNFFTPVQTIIIATALLMICLMLSFIIVYYLTGKNYKPIADLIKLLGTNDEKNDFETIQNSIINLISNNEKYATDIRHQKSIFRNIILSRLLNGDLAPEFPLLLSNYDILFPHENFTVLIIASFPYDHFEDTEEHMNSFNDFMQKTLRKYDAVCYCVHESNQLVLIINHLQSDKLFLEKIQESTSDYTTLISNQYNLVLNAAISNTHQSYMQISNCYFEALEVISYNSNSNTGVYLYSNIQDDKKLYFSLAQEKTIINYLQTGNYKDAEELFSEIFSDIGTLAPQYSKPFLYDIICMFIKVPHIINLSGSTDLLDELKFPNFYTHIHHLEDFSNYVIDITHRICNYVSKQKNELGYPLAKRVAAYIEANFTDCNLSIASIAEYVQRSVSYINAQFKSEFNIPVYEYINKYRIEAAKRYIQEYMPIKNVSINVGYSNIRTFNRIFKDRKSVV